MSTRMTATNDVPGDVETVLATLTSPAWAQHKADVLHDGSRVVQHEQRPDGGVLLAVSRELPQGVPGFLERFLPADGRVLQTDEWAAADGGARTGRWRVELPGSPASLGGTLRLDPLPAGTRWTIEGEVVVRVPLVGGKAERLIGDMVVQLAAKEAALLRDAPTPPAPPRGPAPPAPPAT